MTILAVFLYLIGFYVTSVVFRFPDMPTPPWKFIRPLAIGLWPLFWLGIMLVDISWYTKEAFAEWRLTEVKRFFNDTEPEDAVTMQPRPWFDNFR
jgi:hypothetical protein